MIAAAGGGVVRTAARAGGQVCVLFSLVLGLAGAA